MNKNFTKAYLLVMTLFCVLIFASIPFSITSVIFGGMFVVNVFLFLDAVRKD